MISAAEWCADTNWRKKCLPTIAAQRLPAGILFALHSRVGCFFFLGTLAGHGIPAIPETDAQCIQEAL